MNNKMAINIHLSTIDSKKQSKQEEQKRIMDLEYILMVARWACAMGEWVKR